MAAHSLLKFNLLALLTQPSSYPQLNFLSADPAELKLLSQQVHSCSKQEPKGAKQVQQLEEGEAEVEEEIGEQLLATIVENQDSHSRFLQVWLTDSKILS